MHRMRSEGTPHPGARRWIPPVDAAFLQNASVACRQTRGSTPGWYAMPRWGTPDQHPGPQNIQPIFMSMAHEAAPQKRRLEGGSLVPAAMLSVFLDGARCLRELPRPSLFPIPVATKRGPGSDPIRKAVGSRVPRAGGSERGDHSRFSGCWVRHGIPTRIKTEGQSSSRRVRFTISIRTSHRRFMMPPPASVGSQPLGPCWSWRS